MSFRFRSFKAVAAAAVAAVTIQFKEYGVRLNFKPTIIDEDHIRLELEPEVSTIDFANGVRFEGFRGSCASHQTCPHRCRAARRSELCARRTARQQRNAINIESSRFWVTFRFSETCSSQLSFRSRKPSWCSS